MKSLSVVTTCKSRLRHLQQSLPLMLAGSAQQVIVVDYGCNQGTAAWVRAHHPQVQVLQVEDDPNFNHARARNSGLAHAHGDYVAFVDADVLLKAGWFEWWDSLHPAPRCAYRYADAQADRSAWGSFVCARADLRKVNGYDEMFKGWGGEDDDMYSRLESVGCEFGAIPVGLMGSIAHDDHARTQHMPIGSKLHSFLISRYYRTAKVQAMAFFRAKGELPLEIRRQIDAQIRRAFEPFLQGKADRPPRVELTMEAPEGLTPDWHLGRRCVFTLEPKDIKS